MTPDNDIHERLHRVLFDKENELIEDFLLGKGDDSLVVQLRILSVLLEIRELLKR